MKNLTEVSVEEKAEHLGLKYFDMSQRHIKDFVEKDGIHFSKKEQVGDMMKHLRDLVDSYAFSIENIMTEDKEVKDQLDLKHTCDQYRKLDLIKLITNF